MEEKQVDVFVVTICSSIIVMPVVTVGDSDLRFKEISDPNFSTRSKPSGVNFFAAKNS